MNCDQVPVESQDDTMMFCDESPSLDASMNARGLRKITNLGYETELFVFLTNSNRNGK